MLTMADLRTLATASLVSETPGRYSRGPSRFMSEGPIGTLRLPELTARLCCRAVGHSPTGPGRLFDPGLLDIALKPPLQATVQPTAVLLSTLLQPELPIVGSPVQRKDG